MERKKSSIGGEMMKKCIILVIILLVSSLVEAKTHENVGTCVGQFLKIGVGARPCGMGEAFSAVADDVNAIYWNPAGLTQIKEIQATFMHNEWLHDLRYEFLAYCQPINTGVRAISITYLRMGDMEGKDKNDNPLGNFGAYDYALNIAYAIPANENLYVGITGKFIQQKIEIKNATAIALDIGILHLVPSKKGLKLAAVLQNLGTSLRFVQKREWLPIIYKIGGSYKKNNFILASDITKPEDNYPRINLGIEYLPISNLAFRLGYNSRNDLDSGWTFGIGFTLKTLQIDYGFIPYGELDNTHRVSITKRF